VRLILLRPTDAIARRFEEWNVRRYRLGDSLFERGFRWMLGRKTLPW